MSDYTFLLQNLFLLFLFFVMLKLLAKTRLLPLYLYLTAAELIVPALRVEHQFIYYGIASLLLLYSITYWLFRYKQHRQKEAAALGDLIARARPLYEEEHCN